MRLQSGVFGPIIACPGGLLLTSTYLGTYHSTFSLSEPFRFPTCLSALSLRSIPFTPAHACSPTATRLFHYLPLVTWSIVTSGHNNILPALPCPALPRQSDFNHDLSTSGVELWRRHLYFNSFALFVVIREFALFPATTIEGNQAWAFARICTREEEKNRLSHLRIHRRLPTSSSGYLTYCSHRARRIYCIGRGNLSVHHRVVVASPRGSTPPQPPCRDF